MCIMKVPGQVFLVLYYDITHMLDCCVYITRALGRVFFFLYDTRVGLLCVYYESPRESLFLSILHTCWIAVCAL